MSSDDYSKALDSLGDAIRAARELIERESDARRTYAAAIEKRELERQLRAAGYTRAEAREKASRAFKIHKLEKRDE